MPLKNRTIGPNGPNPETELVQLDDTLARIDSGQGTLGQLIVNPQLRDSLQRVNQELKRLTADFSKHPTRFVQLRYGLF